MQKSPTVDEQGHLFRGVAYVETGATHFLWGHPLLASALNALPLLTVPDLRLPTEEPSWAKGDWEMASDDFLWRLNPNAQQLIILGRLATIWLTLILSAVIYRWGRQLNGRIAGLIALALLVLDPNVLAHGQLVTSDLALTFFMVVAVYGYWRWAMNVGISANSARVYLPLVVAGAGLGAAAATKFSAALLMPTLGILALLLMIVWRSVRPLQALLLMGLAAWATVWALYRLDLTPLPGGAFWDDLVWQFDYLSRPHGAYLLGRADPWGWWYYFPVAFLVKTPLPILILLGWAVAQSLRELWGSRRDRQEDAESSLPTGNTPDSIAASRVATPSTRFSLLFTILPPLVYFAISMASPLNIGYRHLIPLLPFLALFIATTLTAVARPRPSGSSQAGAPRSAARLTRYLLIGLIGLLFLVSLLSWPNYIPYFNGLTSWSGQSWRILSDSNIDWGQDLPALAAWQQEQGERLKLSYFGVAHPSRYGIKFDALPTWSPGLEQMNPAYQPYYPADPAPGVYAISVTNLHGLVLDPEQGDFAWFRDREPIARVGGSIFVYRVEPKGEAAQVAFAGLQPADLAPNLHGRFQTNDVRPRWFDARTSLLWPAGNGWLAVAGQTADPALQPFWPSEPVAQSGDQSLYRLSGPLEAGWDGQRVNLGGKMTFLGHRRLPATEPGEISLLTAWQVEKATGQPFKIFVHALDVDENLVGQWDGLDVEPTTWQAGDIFIQLHRFTVPENTSPRLMAGMYDGVTQERLAEPIPLE